MTIRKHPSVSIIIPIFNIESYLATCLISVCNQTLKDIEILCIDDGSTDGSYKILESFAAKDPRIRIYQQNHNGVSTARNLGIKHALGKYILFIDGDDWIEEDMLQQMFDQAELTKSDIVICAAKVHCNDTFYFTQKKVKSLQNALTITRHLWQINVTHQTVCELLSIPCTWPFIWNKLIRKSVLEQYDILFCPELILGEDGLFVQTLYQYINHVIFMENTFYHYRYRRSNSATIRLYQNNTTRFDNHIKVIEMLLKTWKKRMLIEQKRLWLVTWIINFLYCDFIMLPPKAQQNYAKRINELVTLYGLLDSASILCKRDLTRLKHMLHPPIYCSKIMQIASIIKYKFDEHVSKIC